MNAPQHMKDDRFDALLDDALAPDAPSPDLSARVMAATRDARAAQRRPAVAGRIPAGAGALAAAAVIALVMVGAWMLRAPAGDSSNATVRVAQVEAALDALDRAAARDTSRVDHQIEVLELHVELARTEPMWPGEADPLSAGANTSAADMTLEPMWVF